MIHTEERCIRKETIPVRMTCDICGAVIGEHLTSLDNTYFLLERVQLASGNMGVFTHQLHDDRECRDICEACGKKMWDQAKVATGP